MYSNTTDLRCKLEIGFKNLIEVKNFYDIMVLVNSISKDDYSFLVQQLEWLMFDIKKLAGIPCEQSELPFSDNDGHSFFYGEDEEV